MAHHSFVYFIICQLPYIFEKDRRYLLRKKKKKKKVFVKEEGIYSQMEVKISSLCFLQKESLLRKGAR